MRICLLAPATSTHTQRIAKSLAELKHKVTILTFHYAKIDGIDVIPICQGLGWLGKIRYPLSFICVRKAIKKISPDILHAHYMSSYGLAAAMAGFRPYILSVWGTDIFAFAKKNLFAKYLSGYILKRSDLIMSTSEIMGKEVAKYTNKRVIITPFGIDCDKFKPNDKTTVNNDEILIGIVKSLEYKYGHEYLLKAFKMVLDMLPSKNIRLEILGAGSLERKLKDLARFLGIDCQVSFRGHILNDDLPSEYNKFAIAVFPSVVQESFGVSLLEAQACGVPVVASAVGGFHEVVKDGQTGLLVPPRDTEALARAICALINDEKLRNVMSGNARGFVCNNYRWEKTVQKFETAYWELTV